MARITQLFSIPSFVMFSSRSSDSCSVESPKSSTLKLKQCQSQLVSKIPFTTTSRNHENPLGNGKVQQVQSIKEFDKALGSSYNELVLVGFAPNHDYYTSKIVHFMKELQKTCNHNVRILYVVGDGSEKSKELCRREGFSSNAPVFCFYEDMQKVHQVEGLKFDQLICDVSYHTKNHSNIVQLHSKEDFGKLIRYGDQKLIVVNISLKLCDPCARVYPTLLQLSKQMYPIVVFARMNGDCNDSCKEFLREMNVHEVPTFLFVKNGNICGRYVGSNRSNLVMEVVKHKDMGVMSPERQNKGKE